MQDLSSPTKDQTRVSALKPQSINHWTAKEVPPPPFKKEEAKQHEVNE